MLGIVEIFRGDELVAVEDNMVLDGAGELLADIMTISPSLSSTSSSAILDTSNFTIQAISFGKDSSSYNAHSHSSSIIAQGYDTAFDASGTRPNIFFCTSSYINSMSSVDTSSVASLPNHPKPIDVQLEDISPEFSALAVLSGGFEGQNMNFIGLYSDLLTEFGLTNTEETRQQFVSIGAYPSGTTYALNVAGTYDADTSTIYIDTPAGSTLNNVSSIDMYGFIKAVPGTDPSQGLVTSSNLAATNEVQFAVRLGVADTLVAECYGGITIMGLWAIDLKETLKNAQPPFEFTPVNNPIKYRLYSKKVFSKNITYSDDIKNMDTLSVRWGIIF